MISGIKVNGSELFISETGRIYLIIKTSSGAAPVTYIEVTKGMPEEFEAERKTKEAAREKARIKAEKEKQLSEAVSRELAKKAQEIDRKKAELVAKEAESIRTKWAKKLGL